jgi:glucan biosynthesis protein C
VIAVHTAITYGLDGSWYLESYDQMGKAALAAVTAVLGIGWLFGLGLFFLIAGRLSGPSLDRKGPRRFARDRLIRLGVPLLGYTLLITPFLEYVDYCWNGGGSAQLWAFVREQIWHLAPGPTWFLEVLLAFSLSYALLGKLRAKPEQPRPRPVQGRQVAAVAVAIALVSFAVRFAFPLGSEQFHVQLSVFPHYVILFSVGEAGALAALALPTILVAGGFFAGHGGRHQFQGAGTGNRSPSRSWKASWPSASPCGRSA